MIDYAYEIKKSVTMRQVCELYGVEVNRAGFACCPFHAEDTPSFRAYDGDRGFHCFGCNSNGDIITFVEKYFSLTFRDAIVKLNYDFNLRLPIDEKPTWDAIKAANNRKRAQIAAEIERKRIKERYSVALDKYVELDRKRAEGALRASGGVITDEYATVLKCIDAAKQELDEAEARLYEYENRSAVNS